SSGSMTRKFGPSRKQSTGQTSTQSVNLHLMQFSVTTWVMVQLRLSQTVCGACLAPNHLFYAVQDFGADDYVLDSCPRAVRRLGTAAPMLWCTVMLRAIAAGDKLHDSHITFAAGQASRLRTPRKIMRNTLSTLRKTLAAGRKLSMLTCYDAGFARAMDEAGVDCLLVGDSLGMVVQ